jgi:hypothetical protein
MYKSRKTRMIFVHGMQLVILFNLVCLIVDASEVKLPGEAKQINLPPEYGQPIYTGENGVNRRKLPFMVGV